MTPFFTIITATRNVAGVLPRLLESLAAQTCRDFVWVVQDGASTDDTLSVIEAWCERLPCVSVESVPDTGIYDAWNKAIDRQGAALGQWVLFLGADDCLDAAHSLATARTLLESLPSSVEYAATSLQRMLMTGEVVDTVHPSATYMRELPAGMPLPHSALFHKSVLFLQHSFNSQLHIASDYELLCRTARTANVVTSDIIISRMCIGGVSGSLATMLQRELEFLQVSRQYFPYNFPLLLYARICRSALCKITSYIFGEKVAHICADIFRKMQNKPTLWTR